MELARANTWQARLEVIKAGIERVHPRASVVVVTYNNLAYTRLCVESVLRNTLHPNVELIVVDNGSGDGTAEYLRGLAGERAGVRAIVNVENRGFGAAVNQGLGLASGEYLVVLNNDTVLPNGWLSRLVRHLEDPRVGLVVSVTNFSGNESRIEAEYGDLEGLEEFAARYGLEHEGEAFDIRVAAMYCVAMRREAYERVGPIDERFEVGLFEDDDYSHRMRLAGYRVVCAEDAYVHHFGQASFKQLSAAEYQAIWDRNRRLYEEKWAMTWQPYQLRS
ncbi:MAG TPA: glycosyltransferase family 2 protein [Chloroflexota bacterium]|nr:glycosyltransferase family 2 protein [Chloroflexota bacterium]